MEFDETPEESARRELEEEIGLHAATLITRDTQGEPRVDGTEVSQARFFAPGGVAH